MLSNEYKIFTIVQAYNNESTIKFLPLLDYRNYIYELFKLITENIDLKLQQKLCIEYTILYIHCVDLLIRSLTKLKLKFLFYDFL